MKLASQFERESFVYLQKKAALNYRIGCAYFFSKSFITLGIEPT